jgi:hypothetical protein
MMAAVSPYGNDLDPNFIARQLRETQTKPGFTETNITPSTIDQGQTLFVNLQDLDTTSVIKSKTLGLVFNIELSGGSTSPNANRTVVNSLGRAIVKRMVIKMAGFVLYDLNEADIYFCCKDLWEMTDQQRADATEQGIHISPNVARIKIGAGNADTTIAADVALAAQDRGNCFVIPLNFDLFTNHLVLGESRIDDPIKFEIAFNTYANVITSTNSSASYKITNIKLRHRLAKRQSLANELHEKYKLGCEIPYLYIHNYRKLHLDKSSALWNIDITQDSRSLRGILMVFEDLSAGKMGPAFGRNPEYFVNPDITSTTITIDGLPNEIYPQGYQIEHQWEEARLGLVPEDMRDRNLQSVRKADYCVLKFAWWLDFRDSSNNTLHGNGWTLKAAGSVVLQMNRATTSTGTLNCYIYLEKDAVLKIQNNRYVSVVF